MRIDAAPNAIEQRTLGFDANSSAVALRWQALDALALRIQCSWGFLPPPLSSLSDKALIRLDDLHLVDPARNNEPLDSALVIAGGNYDLRPEKSRSCGGGVVLTDAQRRWRFSVDYNKLRITQGVLEPGELFFRDPQRYLADYPLRLQRAPLASDDPSTVGKITTIESWSINVARQELETIDVLFSWSRRWLGGDVALSMLGSAQPVSTRRGASFTGQVNDAGIGNLASPVA